MRTPSILMTMSPLLSFRMNSSTVPAALSNSSSTSLRLSGLGMSFFTMTFGAISNLTALGILVKSRVRFRRQSKTPFLILTVALLIADLGGHLIPGSFAMSLHINKMYQPKPDMPNETLCQIFGASMVFFGLTPLLLGCAMAVERVVAICFPFFHASTITKGHVRRVVLSLYSLALLIAILPLFDIGKYTAQHPGTWCFLQIQIPHSRQDRGMALAFSCLGITALAFSLLCNILSGLVLLQARRKAQYVNTKSDNTCARRPSTASSTSLFCSLDVEMMVQLAVLTVVSCVCWSPFLIHILVLQSSQSSGDLPEGPDRFLLLGLRMASWNQILDPWVYILLRRTVLFRVCCRRTFTNFKYSRRETFVLQ
ncbi:prostaglandin E2 receptor EP1 subtype-like isoform X2 [Boleophthalmus pectinirostris]|nr:prostaglandin E2 receptor EP1 subtype-like isoform X2 [Boleophthalmus pectinirostris]XP_055003920.1 prostaglandin E2 receptor EP1 subtype-like isoform X2 [Boleophthalmus pectinirostris]